MESPNAAHADGTGHLHPRPFGRKAWRLRGQGYVSSLVEIPNGLSISSTGDRGAFMRGVLEVTSQRNSASLRRWCYHFKSRYMQRGMHRPVVADVVCSGPRRCRADLQKACEVLHSRAFKFTKAALPCGSLILPRRKTSVRVLQLGTTHALVQHQPP